MNIQKLIALSSRVNPIWKDVARHLVKNCTRCGQPRLYSVFDAYITGNKPSCIGCSSTFRLARLLIKRVFKKIDLTDEIVKKLMDDIFIRKSMLNVVRGISHFSLKLPQLTAVPVVIVWNYTNRCNLS